MDKDSLIHLTKELYKMTLLFPKKEPLRYKMRELADDILANSITWQARFNKQEDKDLIFTITRDLEILDSYFRVAEDQNWVSPSALSEIKAEYDKMKGEIGGAETNNEEERLDIKEGEFSGMEANVLLAEEINKQIEVEREKTPELIVPEPEIAAKKQKTLDLRKEKIIEFLKDKGTAQVWEVNKILPDVSKRTLRRDFQQLLKESLIERIGQRNETFYRLKTEEV